MMRFSRCCNVMSWIFPALVSQSDTVSCLPASRTRVGRCDMTVVGLARCPFFVLQPKRRVCWEANESSAAGGCVLVGCRKDGNGDDGWAGQKDSRVGFGLLSVYRLTRVGECYGCGSIASRRRSDWTLLGVAGQDLFKKL
ncbi:uncharacterized protein B0T23DRAFT_132664 [Neurospora hispaniola]|uniref:Uncharacterized protein n=1 Tax=Neurospora hispaniola TaxID=588809 RepID=A0AAJ0MQW1_9PEZI|nr:hypothetical protein B0T23DRAFT_132664 [Neurospora hispaniola]